MKEILKFSAPWCAPCKALAMTMAEAGDLGVSSIREINVDIDKDSARQYGVRTIPTLILLELGRETKRVNGNITLKQLKEFANETI